MDDLLPLLCAHSPWKQHLTLHARGAKALASEENCVVVMFGMIGVTFLLHKGPTAHILKAPGRVASLDEADWLKEEKEKNSPGKLRHSPPLTRLFLTGTGGPAWENLSSWSSGVKPLTKPFMGETGALQFMSLFILGLPLHWLLLLFVGGHVMTGGGVWLDQMVNGSRLEQIHNVDVKYLYSDHKNKV